MSRLRHVDVLAYALLGAAATVSIMLPGRLSVPATHAAAPTTIRLHGTVRDFRDAHPDFDLGGIGHYAGNIALETDDDARPVFAGGGFRVTSQWYDDAGRPISSIVYGGGASPRLAVASRIIVGEDCEIDSYDSRLGPYGPGNAGHDAVLSVDASDPASVSISTSGGWIKGDVLIGQGGDAATVIDNPGRVTGATGSLPQPVSLPTIELPTDVGSYLGPQDFDNAGTINVTENLHWGDTMLVGTRFVFHGHRTILVDGYIEFQDTSVEFDFMPDSSLKLYCTDYAEIDDFASLNMDSGKPSLLTLYMTGTYPGSGDEATVGLVDVEDAAQITADIVAPAGKILMEEDSHIYGTAIAATVEITTGSRIHVDQAVFSTGCGSGDGAMGTLGAAGDGGITSAASFEAWFTDRLGTNLTGRRSITLIRDAFGVYEHLNDAFHPIDGALFGNEGNPNNGSFTYEIDATFEHTACAGQFVEFEGGDGAWLFIDGRLLMDLGGVDPAAAQYLDLDRLGLAEGEHRFQLFYAHRDASQAVFRLRTNLELATTRPTIQVTVGFD